MQSRKMSIRKLKSRKFKTEMNWLNLKLKIWQKKWRLRRKLKKIEISKSCRGRKCCLTALDRKPQQISSERNFSMWK